MWICLETSEEMEPGRVYSKNLAVRVLYRLCNFPPTALFCLGHSAEEDCSDSNWKLNIYMLSSKV